MDSQLLATLEMESGVVGTITINAESAVLDRTYFAIYGKKGILYLGCPDWFNGEMTFFENSHDFGKATRIEPVLIEDPYGFKTNSRGAGLADIAWAIREGREPRVNAARCYHVLDIPTDGEESSLITKKED